MYLVHAPANNHSILVHLAPSPPPPPRPIQRTPSPNPKDEPRQDPAQLRTTTITIITCALHDSPPAVPNSTLPTRATSLHGDHATYNVHLPIPLRKTYVPIQRAPAAKPQGLMAQGS